MSVCVFAQRNVTAQAFETALISNLETRGWTVQVETGSLAAIDWSGVRLLIIGAPGTTGTDNTAHTDAAALNGYPVDIVSLCRNTSRNALQMASSSTTTTVTEFTRTRTDDRAPLATITFASTQVQCISGVLTTGTYPTLMYYRLSVSSVPGIAERVFDGYSRVHWGHHRFDTASTELLDVWALWVPTLGAVMDATEDDDVGEIRAKWMPPGGYTVALDVAEEDDAAAFEATFYPLMLATLATTEDSDVAAFSAENRWDDAANVRGVRIIYRCTIEAEGYDTIEVPISSWQATLQTGRSSYVQAVVPAASALYPAIAERAAGEFVIYRGAQFESGLENLIEMARAPMGVPVLNQGPQRATVTLSGYTTAYTDLPAGEARTLTAIRSLSISSGLRVRCAIDWRLRPGSTATAGASSFTVAYINYYVGGTDSYMDVGERAL